MGESFSANSAPNPSEESQPNKLIRLRHEIRRAEEREDEQRVLMLEAELKAAEAGEAFDKEKYLDGVRRKERRGVITGLQNLNRQNEHRWNWDGAYQEGDFRSYDEYFKKFLHEMGYTSFEDLVHRRSEFLERKLAVLDLFGGAYFLQDLKDVEKIVGVRLENRDPDFEESDVVRKLSNDERRKVLEGNLYESKTWKTVAREAGEGFDLITCRPVGPFGHTASYVSTTPLHVKEEPGAYQKEEIYITLLNRTLNLLSPDGGMLFLQQPILETPIRETREFWKRYMDEKNEEGFEFSFSGAGPEISELLAVVRNGPTHAEEASGVGGHV